MIWVDRKKNRDRPPSSQTWGVALVAMTLTMGGCGMVKLRGRAPRPDAPDLLDVSSIAPKSRPVATVAPAVRGGPAVAPVNDAAVKQTDLPQDPSPAAIATPVVPTQGAPYAIDLNTSLRLADGENPTLAQARVAILEALAVQTQARVLLIPSLNAGMNYHGHDGDLQRSSGRILRLSEQSFYIGGGARTLAAETIAIPAVNINTPLTDAIFEPLAARQQVAGARLNAAASANSILLEVTQLFFDLTGAEAVLESRRQSATEAAAIVKVVQAYAATGEGRAADANRANTELGLFQGDIQHAEELVAVASARLSRRLNLDPAVRLQPLTGPLEPLQLIDANQAVESLIQAALAQRPDLAARSAQISQAEFRLKEEKARPLLPTLWFGFSGGAFGGGSNLVPPLVSHFGGRTDLDVRATWTVLNFGAGNASLIKRRRAEVGAALAERARTLNKVRADVTSAKAEAIAQVRKVEVARAELASAESGYREDFQRLRETVGLPIEVIDSLRLLAQARINLIEAIVRSNQAQFALFVSLGTPPPLDPNSAEPSTAPPIATPLRSPIVMPGPEPSPHIAPPSPPVLGR